MSSGWQTLPTNTACTWPLLKRFMMRRMANDADNAGSDPGYPAVFPTACVPGYDSISDKANGLYLESPDAEDLDQMLARIYKSIVTRLIS